VKSVTLPEVEGWVDFLVALSCLSIIFAATCRMLEYPFSRFEIFSSYPICSPLTEEVPAVPRPGPEGRGQKLDGQGC
jgi:hypothetical protein